jgi:hypothetical protein
MNNVTKVSIRLMRYVVELRHFVTKMRIQSKVMKPEYDFQNYIKQKSRQLLATYKKIKM